MKKLFSLVLSAVMLLSCFAFTVSAKEFSVSDGKDITLAIDDVSAKAGDTITVKVFVKFAEGHAGISDGQFVVNYPTDKLELVIEETSGNITNPKWLFPGATVPTVVQEAAGSITASFANFNPVAPNTAADGDFFEMQFKVKEVAEDTTADITFATATTSTYFNTTVDFMPTRVEVELINGSVDIKAVKYFKATFESAHGEVPEAISIADRDEDGNADEAFQFPGYDGKQDEHFTFDGWTDGTTDYAASDEFTLTEDVTFTAKWIEDPKATVTYVDTAATAPEAVTDYVDTEITIAAPDENVPESFEFLGWTDGQNVYQAGKKLTIDADGVTLTAKWRVKVAVEVNGAKGTAPEIGGEIGEEIDLPTEVELTKVNNAFVGFALSAGGEVITGKYTVNPEDTLYVIWEEDVSDAGIIETKVVYNSATNDYTVDMYFYGKDANTVAFGYTYGENLTFVGFVPGADLFVLDPSLEVNEEGYYAYGVTDEVDGKIEGAAASSGNGVHLGTITFAYELTKEDYATDDAADNIAITAPASVVEHVSSEKYFLYVPAVSGLEVVGRPIVFDEAIEYEMVDVVYTVNGSVKVVREDGTDPKNIAEIAVLNAQGNKVKTFVIENENIVTEDGIFSYEIGLAAGEYTLVISKTGYLDAKVDVEIAVQEGADEEGFVPTPVDVELATLIAGNVAEDFDVIDHDDFVGITSSFGMGDLEDNQTIALDIDEDGVVNVFDLIYVKGNYGAEVE